MATNNQQNADTRIGQYYLTEEIAQGGMAKIYKGISYDAHGIQKVVVIKKILPHISASKEFIDALVDEAKTAVSLSHGNIAQIYDLGKSDEDYFIVMEYVDGKSLSAIHKRCLSQGKLIPVKILCHFICEALNGLDYIHKRMDENKRPLHIVHRDVSPQNLMITYSGTLKIIDFGIAKSALKLEATDTNILKGKFAYMSPEQARGEPIDHRSDIFSLGIIFHETLTGKRLFKDEDNRQTIRNVRNAQIEPPSNIKEDLPEELDKIVVKALARNRRYRYAFASDMRDDLLKFMAAQYPDFKPSEVTEFMHILFKVEMEKEKEEEDSRTPVQIIEHTSSAIAEQFEVTGQAKISPDMKEFFLEGNEPATETPPKEKTQKRRFLSEKNAALLKKLKRWKKTFPLVALGTATLAAFFLIMGKVQKGPDAKLAEILLTTDPAEAQVLVDNKYVGEGSPFTIKDIKPDIDHLIFVKYEGYASQTKHVKLKAGEFKNIEITLVKNVEPICTLMISSTPSEASVFFDDQETNYKTPAVIKDIKVNKKHSVGLYLLGYKFWRKEFEAHPNETQNFEVQLERDYGSVSVITHPEGALIMLGGNPQGHSPISINKLEPHKIYTVEGWLQGYKPFSQDVRIEAGKEEELHIKLEKEVVIPQE